jgi:hypothetical protein
MMEAARWLVAFVSAGTGIGALSVDYLLSTGRQHIKNPRWPPHAKFHNGQTIMMGLIQGALAIDTGKTTTGSNHQFNLLAGSIRSPTVPRHGLD